MYTFEELKDEETRKRFFEILKHLDDFKVFKDCYDFEEVDYLLEKFWDKNGCCEMIVDEETEEDGKYTREGRYSVEIGIHEHLFLYVIETDTESECDSEILGFDFY